MHTTQDFRSFYCEVLLSKSIGSRMLFMLFLNPRHDDHPGHIGDAMSLLSMKKPAILHPFLFTLFSIATLLAANLGVVHISQVVRPLIFLLTTSVLILLLTQTLFKNWMTAGLMTTMFLFAFFTYGHLHTIMLALAYSVLIRFLPELSGNSLAVWLHPFLIFAWIGFGAFSVRLIRQAQHRLYELTRVFNLISAALLLWPTFQILRAEQNLRFHAPERVSTYINTLPEDTGPDQIPRPDIYYIVLDGYTRADILSDIYGVDNAPFLAGLVENGFYIAENSMSNYAQTVLSLASSLNMTYVDQMPRELDVSNRDVNWLVPLVKQSAVRDFLEQRGYRTVAFASGYGRTEMTDADEYIHPTTGAVGTFESLLIRTTALLILEDCSSLLGLSFPYPGYEAHRELVHFSFEQLPQVASLPGPKFVFLHILIPHPPFVFGPDGEELPQRHKYGLRDASDFQGSLQEYITGYRDQLHFLNQQLEQVLQEIFERSSSTPVVILQGDHGSAAHLDWRSPKPEQLHERMAILNAYYLPDALATTFYDSISPVNTFRIVFNHYFATDLPLLEDASYFSTTYRPFEFTLVTR